MKLSSNAIHVLQQRYLIKIPDGKFEEPTAMMERVANLASTPERKKKILKHLLALDFLPNSPTLMNAGTKNQMLSACFVLPIEDSIDSIFDALKYTAKIHQSGGGTGFSFSKLRPEGFPVKSTQGIASGPLSFMNCFNVSTDVVIQGGKRRGANMGILSDTHPDLLKFIHAKDKGDTLKNFNLSVSVTDAFMNAVKNDEPWNLIWDGKIISTHKAREIFDGIVKHAHDHGDPGIIFIDEINRNNIGEQIEATNPCGELPLLPYESCNLASINLNNFLDLKYHDINYKKLDLLLENLVPFMNDIIDANHYPIPEIREQTLKTRKIGIGIMGWADILIKLNIKYDSEEALILAETLMKYIQFTTHYISKGLNPIENTEWNKEITVIAPTGTISIIAGVSSGIEPLFAVAYKRNLESSIGKILYEIDPTFINIAKERDFYSEALIEKIIKNHGSAKGIVEIPEDVQNLFITAHDLSYESHIKVQAAFQKYTDSAVSKTINMKNDATENDVAQAYIMAWELKCKGITIYRDGSKNQQVLVTDKDLSKSPVPRTRFKDHVGVVREIKTACGTFYNVVTVDEYGLFEDFQINAKKGGCDASQKALGRATSMMLRHNVPVETIVKQFHRVDCNACLIKKTKGESITVASCADGVSNHLQEYNNHSNLLHEMVALQKLIHATFNKNKTVGEKINVEQTKLCPECNAIIVDNAKCGTCQSCGFSKCL